jgi:hypothetical protein
MTPYSLPLTHCIRVVYTTLYLFTQGRGGGELTREKVRGAILHKAGRKYQHGCISSLQTILNNSKGRHLGFGVFCSYLVHGVWTLLSYGVSSLVLACWSCSSLLVSSASRPCSRFSALASASSYPLKRAVLRIHDILVWIRIWIRGSMSLTNRSRLLFFEGTFNFQR